MEEKTETSIMRLYRTWGLGYIGIMENEMETTLIILHHDELPARDAFENRCACAWYCYTPGN